MSSFFFPMPEDKKDFVQNVFSSVANKYDLMNNMMSFGLHHSWKKRLIEEMCYEDQTLLDAAGGTGDIALMFLERGGKSTVVCDLNQSMLNIGKRKAKQSYKERLKWVHANVETLPFESNTFDYYTISFGIRNVSCITSTIEEAYRVLKSGGKFLCLEFTPVKTPIFSSIYNFYSERIIPLMGEYIAKDRQSYEYLTESIKRFPETEIFSAMIEDAGFIDVRHQSLACGIVNLHIGYK